MSGLGRREMCGIAVALDWESVEAAFRQPLVGVHHRGDITDSIALLMPNIANSLTIDGANAISSLSISESRLLSSLYVGTTMGSEGVADYTSACRRVRMVCKFITPLWRRQLLPRRVDGSYASAYCGVPCPMLTIYRNRAAGPCFTYETV